MSVPGFISISRKLSTGWLEICNIWTRISLFCKCWWLMYVEKCKGGQSFNTIFVIEWNFATTPGVKFWGAICWEHSSFLLLLQGSIMAHRYVDDILHPVVPSIPSNSVGAIYQKDYKNLANYHRTLPTTSTKSCNRF